MSVSAGGGPRAIREEVKPPNYNPLNIARQQAPDTPWPPCVCTEEKSTACTSWFGTPCSRPATRRTLQMRTKIGKRIGPVPIALVAVLALAAFISAGFWLVPSDDDVTHAQGLPQQADANTARDRH